MESWLKDLTGVAPLQMSLELVIKHLFRMTSFTCTSANFLFAAGGYVSARGSALQSRGRYPPPFGRFLLRVPQESGKRRTHTQHQRGEEGRGEELFPSVSKMEQQQSKSDCCPLLL